jgi:diadenosine tetraphosphatase ApaH/serine/threonine PP2A family protein phosphatase
MKTTSANLVFKNYTPFLNSTQQELLYVGSKMPIPKFEKETITELIEEALQVLKPQGPLIEIEPPVCIVGDIHGNLRDLLRIISLYFTETDYKFLLLGDYVDRGNFSLEVVTLLYALLVKFPDRFFLLRGNHEFCENFKSSGLIDDCKFTYDDTSLACEIYSSFDWLPIACLIKKEILCLHGGLSPHLNTIDDIRAIKIPFSKLEDEMVADILWSDPNRLVSQFMDSQRGRGKIFSQVNANRFLQANNLRYLVRGHQCVSEGIEFFSDNVITVFSSSYYNDDEENKAGCLLISPNMELNPVSLPSYQHGKRKGAAFVDVPKKTLTRRSSLVYKDFPNISCFAPIPTVIPTFSPKKRRMSGSISLKPVPVSAVVKSPKPFIPRPKIATPF